VVAGIVILAVAASIAGIDVVAIPLAGLALGKTIDGRIGRWWALAGLLILSLVMILHFGRVRSQREQAAEEVGGLRDELMSRDRADTKAHLEQCVSQWSDSAPLWTTAALSIPPTVPLGAHSGGTRAHVMVKTHDGARVEGEVVWATFPGVRRGQDGLYFSGPGTAGVAAVAVGRIEERIRNGENRGFWAIARQQGEERGRDTRVGLGSAGGMLSVRTTYGTKRIPLNEVESIDFWQQEGGKEYVGSK